MPDHHCPSCHIQLPSMESKIRFCPSCGAGLRAPSTTPITTPETPDPQDVLFSLGEYQILASIGKGGMGEVYKAYDPNCARIVALKEIRADLKKYKRLHARFLHEAQITSQLTHPSIMPIYAIHNETARFYYTMPYVEGLTLKQLIRQGRDIEKKGSDLKHEITIPALARTFLQVCLGVAYAHSHQIIHRDLKPENIILGQYGEVLILDWGLGQRLDENEERWEGPSDEPSSMTTPGRIVGTLNYMAPERALGQAANYQTDIYSLGVILYQILTLRMPFRRTSFTSYREVYKEEELPDPVDSAPYRDIPRVLSRIVEKALATEPSERYQTVEEMIHDLEHYTEGRSEWFLLTPLDPANKEHWEFQEHIFITDHTAITRHSESMDWVNLMISKASFSGNNKIEARVRLHERCQGIGFLLAVPEPAEREHPYDGFCLWIGSEEHRNTRLLHSSLEVMEANDVYLKPNEWYKIRIEKVGSRINFFLNSRLALSYVSHLPFAGTHMGLLSRDSHFDLEDCGGYVSSLSLKVNCLAVPDAFLAHGDPERARTEYLRIADAFPGRTEGRDALFRAGVTYIEEARQSTDPKSKELLFDASLEMFESLRRTPGAPLEYLGKGLAYQAQQDFEEEVKCYELAYRRYKGHPLLPKLKEQVVYRMHDTSRRHRLAAYHFILLALRHIPEVAKGSYVRRVLERLSRHWEPLPFIQADPAVEENPSLKRLHHSLILSFWLGKPYTICEILEDIITERDLYPISVANALMSLIELGSHQLALEKMKDLLGDCFDQDREALSPIFRSLKLAVEGREDLDRSLAKLLEKRHLSHTDRSVLFHLLHHGILYRNAQPIIQTQKKVLSHTWTSEDLIFIDSILLAAALWENNFSLAKEIFEKYPVELLNLDSHPLHDVYGCWLAATEGEEIAQVHFAGVLETSFPPTWTLLSHWLIGRIYPESRWSRNSFMWERRHLNGYLALYYHCLGDQEQSEHFLSLAKEETIDAS